MSEISYKTIYKYWISKKDDCLHKDIVHITHGTTFSHRVPVYTIYGMDNNLQCTISEEDFKNMLKRTAGQAIYLWKENDELAKKHFEWAVNTRIAELKSQLDRYMKEAELIKTHNIISRIGDRVNEETD